MKRLLLIGLSAVLLVTSAFLFAPSKTANAGPPHIGIWVGTTPWDGTRVKVAIWKLRTGGLGVVMVNPGARDCGTDKHGNYVYTLIGKASGRTSGSATLPIKMTFSCTGPRPGKVLTYSSTLTYVSSPDRLNWSPYGIILYRKR